MATARAQSHRWPWGALAAPLLVLLAVGPTLSWLEFSGGSESLLAATALEMRRDGSWLLPRLCGEKRIAKPPLPTWITAAAISRDTLDRLDGPPGGWRDLAYSDLAVQMRLTALLAGCGMLLGVYALGWAIGDRRLGLASSLVAASMLIFLMQARKATTDIHLALWVCAANAFLAAAALRGRWWLGWTGAGIALGLAIMSKGPVALVQSVVPAATYIIARSFLAAAGPAVSADDPSLRRFAAPSLGLLLMLLVALPWFAYVALNTPDVIARWRAEVTRVGATDQPPGKWYAYISLFALVVPWTIFLLGGMWMAIQRIIARRIDGLALAMLLLVVPIVIMSLAPDRKARYLLPMAGPAAVLSAAALLDLSDRWARRRRLDTLAVGVHWAMLAVLAAGLPIAGAAVLKTLEGRPWYTPWQAACAAMVMLALLALCWRVRPLDRSILRATVITMLLLHAVLVWGYRDTAEGRSELKPLADTIVARMPGAQVYSVWPNRPLRLAPPELPIYLNRIVRRSADVAAVPSPGDAPQALLIRQRRNTPMPQPPGWAFVQTAPQDDDWWHLFERE